MIEQFRKVVEMVIQDYERELEIVKRAKFFSLNEFYVNEPKQRYIEAKIEFFNKILGGSPNETWLKNTKTALSVRSEVLDLDADVIKELHETYGLFSEEQILDYGYEFWRLVMDGLVKEDKIFSSWNRMVGKYFEEVGHVVEKREE